MSLYSEFSHCYNVSYVLVAENDYVFFPVNTHPPGELGLLQLFLSYPFQYVLML